jgi:hypothetical protein
MLVFNVIFQQYFSYIVAVGHTDGGKVSFLRKPTDKLYHIKLHGVPLRHEWDSNSQFNR